MIDYIHADLFKQTSVPKELIATCDGEQLENILSESFTLNECICKENKLTYGSMCASTVSFSMLNDGVSNYAGKVIVLKLMVDNDSENLLDLGTYYVTEDKLSSNRLQRHIKGENALVGLLYADVTSWYNGLSFPMTLKTFRDSLFTHFDFECVEVDLPNDGMTVAKTLQLNEIKGSTILQAIAEINGAFGNKFEFVCLYKAEPAPTDGLYPSIALFPDESVFPGGIVETARSVTSVTPMSEEVFYDNSYFSVDYANYVSNENGLTNLKIYTQDSDIDSVTVGTGDMSNCYTIEDNFLVYGKNETELTNIANVLYGNIEDISYTPINNALVRGNPCIEPGDRVSFVVGDQIIDTYVLERQLSGIQALKDNFSAKGVENYDEVTRAIGTDLNKTLNFMLGRINALEMGGGGTRIVSVNQLPAIVDPNIVYLIQGVVVVN